WEGVSLDTMFADLKTDESYALVRSYGDYTTNVPLKDLMNHQAWIAFRFEGEDLAPEHGGPARLLVPHLYLWKSAKWVRGMTLMREDKPGFWESLGYHMYGDPWREQKPGLSSRIRDKPGFWESLGYHMYGDPWREQRYSGDE